MTAEDSRAYIAKTKMHDAIAQSVATVLRERPDNPILRMSELLAEWKDPEAAHPQWRAFEAKVCGRSNS